MSDRTARLAELSRKAAWEREDLVSSLREIRFEAGAFRERWRYAGWAASGVAAAATAGWKLFGRNSLAVRAGKVASAASLLIGLARGANRLRRFL
jgi:hypothetical protein